jgi:hypothetical protein
LSGAFNPLDPSARRLCALLSGLLKRSEPRNRDELNPIAGFDPRQTQ